MYHLRRRGVAEAEEVIQKNNFRMAVFNAQKFNMDRPLVVFLGDEQWATESWRFLSDLKPQRVRAVVSHVNTYRAQECSHIATLGPRHLLYSYMDCLGGEALEGALFFFVEGALQISRACICRCVSKRPRRARAPRRAPLRPAALPRPAALRRAPPRPAALRRAPLRRRAPPRPAGSPPPCYAPPPALYCPAARCPTPPHPAMPRPVSPSMLNSVQILCSLECFCCICLQCARVGWFGGAGWLC